MAKQIPNLFCSVAQRSQVTLRFSSQLVTPLNIHGKNSFRIFKFHPKSCLIHWIIQLRLRRYLCGTSDSTRRGIWSRQSTAEEAAVEGSSPGRVGEGPRATSEGNTQLHHCSGKSCSVRAQVQLTNIFVLQTASVLWWSEFLFTLYWCMFCSLCEVVPLWDLKINSLFRQDLKNLSTAGFEEGKVCWNDWSQLFQNGGSGRGELRISRPVGLYRSELQL